MNFEGTYIDEEVFEGMKERALSAGGDELSEKSVVDMMVEVNNSKAKIEAEKLRSKAMEKVALINLAGTVIGLIGYAFFQSRVLHFEETGSVRSFAGRGLQLPKFMK